MTDKQYFAIYLDISFIEAIRLIINKQDKMKIINTNVVFCSSITDYENKKTEMNRTV